jgi:hypothetical protein
MILKYYLFRRDINNRRNYALKIILNSEGTIYRKGIVVLRTLLILKGYKKGDEEKNNSLTQA